jgi:hypothetical protein
MAGAASYLAEAMLADIYTRRAVKVGRQSSKKIHINKPLFISILLYDLPKIKAFLTKNLRPILPQPHVYKAAFHQI